MGYELTKEKYLQDDECAHLEKTLSHFYAGNERDTTLIWLGLYTGARAQEILNLTPKDLDSRVQTVRIHGLKNSYNREVQIPKWLFDKVEKLKSPQAATSQRIFPITYCRFRQIWHLYRPVGKNLHSLRHTFAIKVYRKSRDLRALQMLLGHRAFTSTMIYAEYQYRTDELYPALFWT